MEILAPLEVREVTRCFLALLQLAVAVVVSTKTTDLLAGLVEVALVEVLRVRVEQVVQLPPLVKVMLAVLVWLKLVVAVVVHQQLVVTVIMGRMLVLLVVVVEQVLHQASPVPR
jgi:hypothetical protein